MVLHLEISMLLMSRREQIFCGVMELEADSCILQSIVEVKLELDSGLYLQSV